jgi:hypothetical protein
VSFFPGPGLFQVGTITVEENTTETVRFDLISTCPEIREWEVTVFNGDAFYCALFLGADSHQQCACRRNATSGLTCQFTALFDRQPAQWKLTGKVNKQVIKQKDVRIHVTCK